ncbi:STRUBBELIG-receptor family 3-like protein isoform X1 [Tanacetum coccineum]|uniref:STRUBBELIG-receptor family 3-like protein isoform X1 n=1 Tax=Tanacetum coccineum TaxID=301880 RepID=A0ABQ4ZNB6_9ASTR
MVRHKLMGLKIRNSMEVVKAARIWNLTLKAIIKDGERIILNDLLWSLALKSLDEDGFESAITCINNEYHMNTEISAWSGKSCAVYTSVWQNWFCSGTGFWNCNKTFKFDTDDSIIAKHLGCLCAVIKWVIWCPLMYGYISKWVNWFCFDTIIQSWFSNLLMKGIRIEGEITGSHSFLSRMDLHRLISSLVQDWEAVKDTWMISWNFTSNFCDHEEGNSFASSVPLQITMLPNLEILWAPSANINGEFPRKWGDCRALKWQLLLASAVGILRLSGASAVNIVLTIPMLAPRSFTREDVVELQCHGSNVCLHRVLRAYLEAGTRLAEPGEITLRAFLNVELIYLKLKMVENQLSAKSYGCQPMQHLQEFRHGVFLLDIFTVIEPLTIKKLDDATSQKWNDESFIKLVVNVSKLRNENIFAVEGYCVEHGQRLFVFQYCENGTLHEALHLNNEIHEKLSWNSRVHVALQIAKALEYLHEVCQPPVISDSGLVPLLPSCNISQLQSSGYGALNSNDWSHPDDEGSSGMVLKATVVSEPEQRIAEFKDGEFDASSKAYADFIAKIVG